MKKRKNKIIYKSNLDNASLDELDRFYKNLAYAINILYESVVTRVVKEKYPEFSVKITYPPKPQ